MEGKNAKAESAQFICKLSSRRPGGSKVDPECHSIEGKKPIHTQFVLSKCSSNCVPVASADLFWLAMSLLAKSAGNLRRKRVF